MPLLPVYHHMRAISSPQAAKVCPICEVKVLIALVEGKVVYDQFWRKYGMLAINSFAKFLQAAAFVAFAAAVHACDTWVALHDARTRQNMTEVIAQD